MYTVYTDGAYSSMRNQGGIGVIIINEEGDKVLEYSKMYKNTTNNRMEMMACIVGLESISEPSQVKVISDSQYVIGCATLGWKRKKNVDLWERFDKAMSKHQVTFDWVKGHNTDKYNNECDKIAQEASRQEL